MTKGRLFSESYSDWYRVTILMVCYLFGEYGHYLLGVVSRPMTQELEFGDKSCVTLNLEVEKNAEENCRKFVNLTRCIEANVNGTNYCQYNYSGQGIEYQVLAGPVFILVFTFMGLINGALGDRFSRIRILSINIFIYSVAMLCTGFAPNYWLLALLRFLFGAGESAVTPLVASIVADTFSDRMRAFAMGYFNWGVYFGYGLSFASGNYITQANILGMGWRWCYFIGGAPSILFSMILFFTVKEPERNENNLVKSQNDDERIPLKTRISSTLKSLFTKPVMLLLLIGACFRHSASFCWSYNAQAYFDQYYPGSEVGFWMAMTSIVGGTFGIIIGGVISDRLASRYGVRTRLSVLGGSQLVAAGLACGTLSVAPPYAFIFLLFTYFFAEMWFGVLFTILVEFFPSNMRGTAISIFIFIINNIGGNAPLIVPPIRSSLGLHKSLFLVYAGFYGFSSFFFLLSQLAYFIWKPTIDFKQPIKGIQLKNLKD